VCSNFGLERNEDEVVEFFALTGSVVFPQPTDYFPKQLIPVIGHKPNATDRGLIAVRWSLLPNHYATETEKPQPFNARAETVERVDAFSECFRFRRCVIPATYFREWTEKEPKTRYRLSMSDRGLFGCAGLWDRWSAATGTRTILSATMLTTTPNEMIRSWHRRMPVILHRDEYDEWMDIATPMERLKAMLVSYPAELMRCDSDPRSIPTRPST